MPRIKYETITLSAKKRAMIDKANEIIAEYSAAGYDLTLRQLYYQFVARDLLPNRQLEYKRLGDAINDGRLVGLIDWNAIVDRTRNLRSVGSWSSPESILQTCAEQFKYDPWLTQDRYVEVWIEKDALVGVIANVCEDFRVPYFSCRGYTSQSEMWSAGRRLLSARRRGKTPVVLHFGDHDPSGIDMTRDIEDRLAMFSEGFIHVDRLALNMDQVRAYDPPPNPAKLTDTRSTSYIREYGDESWELDALDPATLSGLIETEIQGLIDDDAWERSMNRENDARKNLGLIARDYNRIIDTLE